MSTGVYEPTLLPDEIKQDMCEALLTEFGASHINVRPNGEMIVRCVLPWHEDKHPSASLNYIKLVYKCLSCQSHGGLLWLIGSCRGVNGEQARAWVEGQTGIGGKEFNLQALMTFFDALDRMGQVRAKPPIPKYSERVLEPWSRICPYLTTGVPDLGIPGRGIPEQNLVEARVGWDLETNRVVIPHFWKGDLVGWQTRRLSDDGTPKYESTAEFPRDTLYRLPRKAKRLVVVESPMSVLRHMHHFDMTATWGANITDAQISYMKWYPEVVFCMDNDPAGWQAVMGLTDPSGSHQPGIERLEPYTSVRAWTSDWHADPADLDDDLMDDLVESAVPLPVWEMPTYALRCLACHEQHGGPCA